MIPEPRPRPELDRAAALALLERPGVARLLDALDRDGEETRIVGGAIRNALIGRPVHEVDLATTAPPRLTMSRAGKAGFKTAPTGIDHGTVTIVVDGEPFEVTTLREDVETDGRHAVVRFGRDFVQDAARRDFTINALTLGRDGALHDTTDGLADLSARRVRFIGEAATRIREDYLRILRLFRFHAEYGEGPIDPAGLAAAITGREGLAVLSRERVRAELLKLVSARRGPEVALVMQSAGLLGRLVPLIGEAGRLVRVGAVEDGTPDPTGRLAAFLVRTREDADTLRERLRLSNAEHARLVGYAGALARIVSRDAPVDADEARRLAVLHGIEAARDAVAATAGEPRPTWTAEGRAMLDGLLSGATPVPRFSLTGAALMKEGVPPGPELGRRLAAEREVWLAAGCPEVWEVR